MILKTIKKILSGLIVGCVIVLSSVGAYNVYSFFKPIQIEQIKEDVMRVKLESIGILKIAESQQRYKSDIVKGKIFKTHKRIDKLYECFYEYDLGDIEIIENIENKAVTMYIDKEELIRSPIRLVEDNTVTTGTIICPIFSDDEINQINRTVEKTVENKFDNDEEFRNKALISLKEKLYLLAQEMGFENIIIKEK